MLLNGVDQLFSRLFISQAKVAKLIITSRKLKQKADYIEDLECSVLTIISD